MAPKAASSSSHSKTTPAFPGKTHKKPAAKPKSPLSDADRLKRLFTSLCAQIDGAHFANALKTCDKILRIDSRDPDALQTKLFLLLQTDQYAPALALVDSLREGQTDKGNAFDYEKAYSLYRLHREDEATEIVGALKRQRKAEDESRSALHLEAQLAYRQGDYQTAFDLYNSLLDTAEPHSDEQADILTNLTAAQSHLDFLTSGYLSALSALSSAVAESLESAPPPAAPSTLPYTAREAEPQTKDAGEPQPKKLRARRIPKGVVLGVTPMPDPERWLKKSERSSAQYGHGKRRRGGGGGATQGIVETPVAPPGGGGKSKKKGKK
ncbi:uncharacterized protein LAESUDRAFT_658784 [Laetiporus sulphureus 93-53]|uniref:Signal recognition particle subunit SRP72 n=1 Tax=Laetiporus sulphureus 93-53 TaxID=1314785 RepID=A0A165D221_9APHY|nr:uncharacterized protein LAESUDRAFT_658784 [Laetiporus sulphureus 93-53]KZT03999.1 hypothetical protein LAESUDRAFT_658784 [Laetiporus sulphureus 93-53]